MIAQHPGFFLGQRRWLVEERPWDRDLADIVQKARQGGGGLLSCRQALVGCHGNHEVRDPDGVVQRTRIMLSQEGRELLDDAASGGGNAGARLADR
jgi:hypothetical protein